MKIGYARVSTDDQNPDLQIAALKKAGCRRIHTDKISGAATKRPGLNKKGRGRVFFRGGIKARSNHGPLLKTAIPGRHPGR